MKFAILLSAAVALTLAWCGAASATTHADLAPLDEYFGKAKLSPLGIENTIHDTNLRVHYDPEHASRYYSTLEVAENALHDWARKYPHDPWLPGRAYFMSHVFWSMNAPQADAAAQRCRLLLFTRFPDSHWALLAKHETKETEVSLPVAKAALPKKRWL